MQFSKRIFLSLPSLMSIKFTRSCSSNLPVPEVPSIQNQPNYRSPALMDFYALIHRSNLTWREIMDWRHKKKLKKIRDSQKFLAERHKILGPDLATTHFITYRGGKVRFLGGNKWMTHKDIKSGEIPSKFSPQFYVEAVDASDTLLCYEGFANFIHLRCMKELYLRNCQFVDDFCLQRLYIMAPTLEHLDISGCINVTERGISTLHRLRKLKMLVIHNTPRIAHRELACLMLQDIVPKCNIEGVDYHNPVLLRKVKKYSEEHDKLLDKEDEKLKIMHK